jgi:hypothetical protein
MAKITKHGWFGKWNGESEIPYQEIDRETTYNHPTVPGESMGRSLPLEWQGLTEFELTKKLNQEPVYYKTLKR